MSKCKSIASMKTTKNKKVKIKLLGFFGKAYGSSKVTLEIGEAIKIREVIRKLTSSSEDLRRVLIDPVLESPLPNAVILLNGKDISALKGLETLVTHGDELVLIPVIHGG